MGFGGSGVSRSVERHGPVGPWWSNLLVAASLLPAAALGQQEGHLSVAVSHEVEYTDNVTRRPDGDDQLVQRPRVFLGFGENWGRTSLTMNYQGEGRYFSDDAFDSQEVFTGSTSLRSQLVPGRLVWDATHTRNEPLLNLRNPDTPANRQRTDLLGTGLNYVVGGRSANTLTLNGRVSTFQSDRLPVESTRLNASASFRRALAPTRGAGVSVSWLQASFPDAPLLPDFRRWTTRANFDQALPDGTLTAGVGWNAFKRGSGSWDGGLSADVALRWRLSGRRALSLSFSRQVTDLAVGQGFGGGAFLNPVVGFRDEFVTDGTLFELTQVQVQHAWNFQRWTFNLGGTVRERDFEGRDLSDRRIRVGASGTYRISRELTARLDVAINRLDFGGGADARQDDRFLTNGSLRWRLGERTSVSVSAVWEQWDSSDPQFGFDVLSFRLGARRTLR